MTTAAPAHPAAGRPAHHQQRTSGHHGNSAAKVVLRTRPTELFADEANHIHPDEKTVTVVRKREQTSATGQRTGEESTSFRFDFGCHSGIFYDAEA